MGDPKFPGKHYDTPSHPWQKVRIEEEAGLIHQYGLKNKKEICYLGFWTQINTTLCYPGFGRKTKRKNVHRGSEEK